MPPLRNNSSPPDVDASSSLNPNTVLHKQVAHSSEGQHTGKRPPIDRWLPSVGAFPGASQTSDALSNLAAPAPIPWPTYSTSHTTNTGAHPNFLIRHESALHARSDSPSPQQRSLSSQHCCDPLSRYHFEPVIRTVAAAAESSRSSFSSSAEAQNQQRRRNSQHSATPILPCPNSATFSAEEGSSPIDTVDIASWAYCPAEPSQGVATVLSRDLPPITAGNENAFPDYPTLSGPFSGTIADAQPTRPSCLILSATAQEDSVDELWAAIASESREHVHRMTDGWIEDAKGVLIFIGIFTTIVASFIIESYKMLSPDFGDQTSLRPFPPPGASIIAVNIMWLISLVFNIVSALFATLALQWTRRYAQLPQIPRAPRDRVHGRPFSFLGTLTYDIDHAVATTITLLHLSVFLFLVGLAIFLFMVHKLVATAVSIVIGLFGVVYLMLTILACIDRSCPYHTPLSDVWWSRRERLPVGHT